ncbi:tRNA-specific adenosine deaminase [candidate division WOR-3 bacterium]|uniref:tRNA-specific adenosine deaminase n=1 Tax=candidate division WOR-3 bacterium TaxID=2052148 RepID=A0A9D5QCD9_UNCW3|nr:tRNA-specific adenosine deaminase [candidate division WOR-3 bacterium]MBD3364454.1 tRNA-specific adenosine deaminase [candidate division WOR-3 bacterium]
MDIDERWMHEALKEAKAAYEEAEIPIGAVVVQEDRIIGRGHNQTEKLSDPTAHAEMIALTAAASAQKTWRLTDCILYVTVEPCFMCAGAAVLARIQRVVFGPRDPKFGGIRSLYNLGLDERLNHTFLVTEGVLADQASALIQCFFKDRRTKKTDGEVKSVR